MIRDYAICVIHYGSRAHTEACLRSTFDIEPAPRGRFVVDNNGSDAPPLELSEDLRSSITIIAPNENLGFGGGANLGFEVIQREHPVDAVLLLNNDAQLCTGAVARLLRTLGSQPSVAMVGPRILRQSDAKIWHDGGRIHWPEGSIEGLRHGEAEPDQVLAPFESDFICGCAPLIRQSAFDSVGGFDERFFLYYEDTDLSLRLLHRGWRLLHDPVARVEHIGSGAVGDGSELARYYQIRNRVLFHELHAPDTAEALRARRAVLRRTRIRALRYALTGRLGAARAMSAAVRDYRRRCWGRR